MDRLRQSVVLLRHWVVCGEGVEIWVEGSPIRKCKVIGTLEFPQHRSHSPVPEDKEWATEVKLHGADI